MSLEDVVITVVALAVSFFVARPLMGGGSGGDDTRCRKNGRNGGAGS